MKLTDAQRLKFRLFDQGVSISPTTRETLQRASGDKSLSSADFASTSGIILHLEDNVWVNAPIAEFNPNFVGDSPYELACVDDGLVVRGAGIECRAEYWPQPAFHGEGGTAGQRLIDYVVTHGDRARLSPVHGCGMACTFCDVPYGVRYEKKVLSRMVEAIARALADPLQPARHLLISGGTPRAVDVGWLREVYRVVLTEFSSIEVDIMMVPAEGLLDIEELADLGVHQLSINLELYSDDAARRYMPQKYRQGRAHYLQFIEDATTRLGPGRVRSMLMVGLEPLEETLLGVRAILERGGVPVLSPFRPDPSTPLRAMAPPNANMLEEAFLRSSEIAVEMGGRLGPSCVPCSHNTLTLADELSTSCGSPRTLSRFV